MNHTQRSLNIGFTLIEMSIVLVIIGLIVGGILVGRDLIYTATIRSQIKQMEQLETAFNTFNVKYSCLPGDCANATTFFGTTDVNGITIVNGDGDGTIKGNYSSSSLTNTSAECLDPDISGEVTQALLQINDAGLGNYLSNGNQTPGPAKVGKEYPYTIFGNGTGIFISCLSSSSHPTNPPPYVRSGNFIVIGAGASTASRLGYSVGLNSVTYGAAGAGTISPIGIPADAIQAIDIKIDDGLPSSGKFGIVDGDPGCTTNATAYPSTSASTCRVTAAKKIN